MAAQDAQPGIGRRQSCGPGRQPPRRSGAPRPARTGRRGSPAGVGAGRVVVSQAAAETASATRKNLVLFIGFPLVGEPVGIRPLLAPSRNQAECRTGSAVTGNTPVSRKVPSGARRRSSRPRHRPAEWERRRIDYYGFCSVSCQAMLARSTSPSASVPVSASVPASASRRPVPEALRRALHRLENGGATRHPPLPLGIREIDAALPEGGLRRGASRGGRRRGRHRLLRRPAGSGGRRWRDAAVAGARLGPVPAGLGRYGIAPGLAGGGLRAGPAGRRWRGRWRRCCAAGRQEGSWRKAGRSELRLRGA